MHNLTVADAHTFYVGERAWLVHNAGPCGPLSDRPAGPSKATGGRYDRINGRGIYVLRDADGVVRYVGRGDAPNRLLDHKRPGSGKENLAGEVIANNNLTKEEAQGLEQMLKDYYEGRGIDLRNRDRPVSPRNTKKDTLREAAEPLFDEILELLGER